MLVLLFDVIIWLDALLPVEWLKIEEQFNKLMIK